MVQTITATYVQDSNDWTVTVSGLGKKLTGKAPGIIAARDRADQLVEKIAGSGAQPTVVHLLNGSAYDFTFAYMTARLARSDSASDDQAAADEKGPATGTARTVTENKAAATAADTPATPATKASRSVPRKELAKAPESTPGTSGATPGTTRETPAAAKPRARYAATGS